MRLWSVALGSLTVIGAVLIGRRLFPGRESLALLLGAAIALLPMLSQQTAIVNNDALVIAGGAWCLVAAIELTRPQRWRWLPLASGFVLGVAILGKPQALVWAPVLAIGWAIGGWRAGRAQRWLFDAGTAVAGVVLSYGPWLVASKAFDYPGVGIAPGEVGPHRGLVDFLHVLSENQFLAVRRTWIRQFWGEFSWIDVSYSDSVYRVILVAVLIGVVVVLAWAVRTMSELVRGRAWRRLELDDGDAAGVVCVVAILGTMAELYLLAFEYFHRTGRNDFLQGRYALMAAVAVLLLPVLALRKLVPRLSPAVPLAVTATAMAVLNVAGLGLLVERFYL
jgi:4-amino-4-deoxy-L-arabinose transferase-like glycosyltransferase